MKLILKVAEAIGKKQSITKDWDQATINKEMDNLTEKNVEQIVNTIFPSGIPTDVSFYESLDSLSHYIGFSPSSNNFLTRIWRSAYKQMLPESQKSLLQSLLEGDNRFFWTGIRCLPGLLPQIESEPQFLSSWLISMAERVGRDLAGGDFYTAVQQYAYQSPKAALAILKKYLDNGLTEPSVTLAAIILGATRAAPVEGRISAKTMSKWERMLKNSLKVEWRVCRHRSWTVSFNLGAVSTEQLGIQLNEMLRGLPEEVDEAFSTVYRCMLGKLEDPIFISFAVDWFINNASTKIPPASKHYVICAMHRLSYRGKKTEAPVDISTMNDLIVVVQPIPTENEGTWSELEYYLVDRLNEGQESLLTILERLADVNMDGLSAQLAGGKFQYLISEMNKTNIEQIITSLLVSKDRAKRRLSIDFIYKLDKVSLSEQVLASMDEVQLRIILFEFIRAPLWEEKAAELFLTVEPYFNQASQELQDLFKKEMRLQAINYPISCLERWKKVQAPSELLQDVISTAEDYFKRLTDIYDSPARSFCFPKFKEFDEKAKRSLSNQISEGMRKQSVLVSLVKHVQVVYGSTWCNLLNGQLNEESHFSEFQESMEFPRVESIDPEGMRIRRINASLELQRLEEKG
ncbi:hypothetical protein ACFLUD_00780 [Chloroflexota bacterium]